mmetsp:Transcript_104217/g.179620  ORF Transcript_104217/g.179620 Transcript_104217/m.179620 type:complete len:84 (-) Transcript_104217:1436-1687(-)
MMTRTDCKRIGVCTQILSQMTPHNKVAFFFHAMSHHVCTLYAACAWNEANYSLGVATILTSNALSAGKRFHASQLSCNLPTCT